MAEEEKQKIKLNELWSVHPGIAKQHLKEDFMLYGSLPKCAARYGIPYETARRWAYSGKDAWEKDREKYEKKVFKQIFDKKITTLKNLVGLSAEVLYRVIKQYHTQEKDLTLEEAQKVSAIIGNIDKVIRLEEDKPTDIIGNAKLSGKEIAAIVREIQDMDEFADYQPEKQEDEEEPPIIN